MSSNGETSEAVGILLVQLLLKIKRKELDVLRDVLDGVRADKNNLTINDLYFTLWMITIGPYKNVFLSIWLTRDSSYGVKTLLFENSITYFSNKGEKWWKVEIILMYCLKQ